MTMRQVESFEIPARGSYELRPGGSHLMLIDLLQPLSIDRPVRFTLSFDDGQTLELGFPVVAPS
jgi:copper(I)-binding protein